MQDVANRPAEIPLIQLSFITIYFCLLHVGDQAQSDKASSIASRSSGPVAFHPILEIHEATTSVARFPVETD
jgi:hypothetical protein